MDQSALLADIREALTSEFARHMGVLSEEFQDKLAVVAEGHQMLSEQMVRMETSIRRDMQAELAVMKSMMQRQGRTLDRHTVVLDQHTAQLEQLQCTMEQKTVQINTIQHTLDTHLDDCARSTVR